MPRRRRKRITRPTLVGASLLLAVIVWIGAGWLVRWVAPELPFELLEHTAQYEVRHYPELTVAQVVIEDSLEKAFAQAEGILDAYREGHNLKQPIEITTVRGKTTEASAMVNMRWPLLVEEVDGVVTVSMFFSEEVTPDTAPRPKDPRIRIDTLERQRIAVRNMSGTVDADEYHQEYQALLADLEASQLLILSGPRYAYYGPSWVAAPLRHGEVHVRVR